MSLQAGAAHGIVLGFSALWVSWLLALTESLRVSSSSESSSRPSYQWQTGLTGSKSAEHTVATLQYILEDTGSWLIKPV